MSALDNKHLLEVIQSGTFKTVKVVFDYAQELSTNEANVFAALNNAKKYTYKTSFEILSGDLAIVNVRGEFKVVLVVEVCDDDSLIDLNSNHEYKWLVQKVDVQPYVDRIKAEREFKAKVNRLLKQQIAKKLRKEIIEEIGDINLIRQIDHKLADEAYEYFVADSEPTKEQSKPPIKMG